MIYMKQFGGSENGENMLPSEILPLQDTDRHVTKK